MKTKKFETFVTFLGDLIAFVFDFVRTQPVLVHQNLGYRTPQMLGSISLITRHDPVAAIVPAEVVTKAPGLLLSLAGTGAGLWGGDSALKIAALRDEWNS